VLMTKKGNRTKETQKSSPTRMKMARIVGIRVLAD
jgi:hypothetical protein